ncbi:MAG: SDR family oxidoreductase [Planctomycetes bacterium]|nr:SDR family oxidoreductase [Planctomycetota bacterium]
MELSGKRAIVTGAAQGLGFAIAQELVRCGCAVALVDRNADKCRQAAEQLTAAGNQAYGIVADIACRDGCQSMASAAATALGGIDILVNNAGILHSSSIENTTEEEWDRVLAVNLKGVFFCCQAALPYLRAGGNSRVINISSLAGRMGGYQTGLAYSASKGGVIALTMGMARQLAPDRITVNCICPGTAETDIIKAWSAEAVASLQAKIPLGRLGQGADVAAAVAFFASDAAAFITGVSLDVNGGMFMG